VRALSIRQPFAELILRGIKTVEYRSRPTRIIGERFHIYASKTPASRPIWSEDLQVAHPPPPLWMIELAEQVGLIDPDAILPTGVIVGTAEVARCELLVARGNSQQATSNDQPATPMYAWHLAGVERAKTFRKPKKHPQPVWFNPFD
jgi:ASCH domain